MASEGPAKKNSVRAVRAPVAFGRTHEAPACILMHQMATSVSLRDAHDRGGGDGARLPASSPATTMTSVVLPASSAKVHRGTSPLHSIAKCGSTILSARGRFNQI